MARDRSRKLASFCGHWRYQNSISLVNNKVNVVNMTRVPSETRQLSQTISRLQERVPTGRFIIVLMHGCAWYCRGSGRSPPEIAVPPLVRPHGNAGCIFGECGFRRMGFIWRTAYFAECFIHKYISLSKSFDLIRIGSVILSIIPVTISTNKSDAKRMGTDGRSKIINRNTFFRVLKALWRYVRSFSQFFLFLETNIRHIIPKNRNSWISMSFSAIGNAMPASKRPPVFRARITGRNYVFKVLTAPPNPEDVSHYILCHDSLKKRQQLNFQKWSGKLDQSASKSSTELCPRKVAENSGCHYDRQLVQGPESEEERPHVCCLTFHWFPGSNSRAGNHHVRLNTQKNIIIEHPRTFWEPVLVSVFEGVWVTLKRLRFQKGIGLKQPKLENGRGN